MLQNKKSKFQNLQLIISVVLILGIAATYGFFPEKLIPALADCSRGSNDTKNAFKAIMGFMPGWPYFGL